MGASRYHVIQWATGNTGQRALREVIRHPDLDLVGVRVYDDSKNGIDAGELCGEDPTGVIATTDRDSGSQARSGLLHLHAACDGQGPDPSWSH